MIHCKLHGRLGNNMFNIATGLSLAKQLNTSLTISKTTLAGHRGEIPVDLSLFDYPFNQISNPNLDIIYNEHTLHYVPIPIKDNTIISGVFGSWKYFENIKNEICNKYFIPSPEIKNKIDMYNVSQNALGISVRRGDFLMLQNNHCVLTSEYYKNVLNEYFSSNNIYRIYIFSDDFEWCKQVFGENVIYVQDSIGVQLFMMSKMKNLILSNSTFAWWGAYLNQNNGTIITPYPWLGPAYDNEIIDDVYHPSWVRYKHKREIQNYVFNPNFYN